jgi:hypothetical protein
LDARNVQEVESIKISPAIDAGITHFEHEKGSSHEISPNQIGVASFSQGANLGDLYLFQGGRETNAD